MSITRLLSFAIAFCILQACNPAKQEDGTAAATDLAKLDEEAKVRCGEGMKLQKSEKQIALFQDPMPNPIVFSFQKGTARCADWGGVDHGGVDKWLKVDYEPSCVPNGSLWEIEKLTLYDNIKVDFHLRPVDRTDTSKITMYTAYGYHFSTLRQKLGMETYVCN